MYQKLVLEPCLILVNQQKQPIQVKNPFVDNKFCEGII